jgi:hypothetical protein
VKRGRETLSVLRWKTQQKIRKIQTGRTSEEFELAVGSEVGHEFDRLI